MKQFICTIFCLFLISICASQMHAQSFVSFKSGYAFEFNKTASSGQLYLGANEYVVEQLDAASYGVGVHVGLGVGFMLSENLGLQVAADYVRGLVEQDIRLQGVSTTNLNTTITQIQLSPMLVISTGAEGFNLYSKTGLLLPVMTDFEKEYTATLPNDGMLLQKETLNFSTKMGLVGAIGFLFSTNEKLSIFLEAEAINIALKPNSNELTNYEQNGIDKLSELTTAQKNIDYVDQITNSGNSNEARQALATPVSFSSFGINLGLNIYF